MKLGEIVNPNFVAAFNVLATKEVSVRTGKKIADLTKEINKRLADYEEKRQSLLKKYAVLKDEPAPANQNPQEVVDGSSDGEKTEPKQVLDLDDKGNAKFEGDNFKSFAKEIEELQNVHVLIPSLTVFELGDDCKLSANVIDALGSLIKS